MNLPPPLPTTAKRRLFVFLKLASICVLVVLLHVPLAMTRGVLRERQNYEAAATEEIAGIWGRQQLIVGPVLAVPYGYNTTVVKSKVVNGRVEQVEETELAMATAYFLPDELTITGEVTPEVRRRGIYETVVYSSTLKLGGEIRPDFAAAAIEADRIDWEKARVFFGVSDLRGIRSVGALRVGGEEFAFESAETATGAPYPLVAKVTNVTAGVKLAFSVALSVQGTGRLDLAPVGKTTTAKLELAWADPSFVGASLPLTRHVSAGGFAAEWQSSHLSRGFPQSWTNRLVDESEAIGRIAGAAFGVNFLQPVDGYCLVERAQKYGLLFFVLVFAVFFLFETTAGLRIHPLQYALVGVALCLFFLGFLALSEFLRTELAYGIAAAVCTVMVALYAHTFLRTGWRTVVIGAGLGATYGYLFFVLKSQDYALLAGTAALFGALALLMFFTRRINWYAVEGASPSA